MSIELSIRQEEVKNNLLDFTLDTSKRKCIKLNGIAGCGKSRIILALSEEYNAISSISNKLDQNQAMPNIKFTATTNPATMQLENIGVKDTLTIFSLLALRPVTDYKTGSTVLKQGFNRYRNSAIVLVDEASFISPNLKTFMDSSNHKFILIGDDEQFLSVDNETGSVMDFGCETIQLSQTFRFKDPDFTRYVKYLKDKVSSKFIDYIPNSVGNALIRLNDKDFLSKLTSTFKQEASESLVVTFTNSMATDYDINIRKILGYGSGVKVGDKLAVKGKAKFRAGFKIDSNGGKIYTEVKHINYSGLDKRVSVAGATGAVIIKHLQSANIPYYNVNCSSGKSMFLVSSLRVMNPLFSRLSKNKDWKLLNEVQDMILPITYGLASTAHSAQGLTVKNVFIDLIDLSMIGNVATRDTIARLIYVAISRASHKVYIRGQVPSWLVGKYE